MGPPSPGPVQLWCCRACARLEGQAPRFWWDMGKKHRSYKHLALLGTCEKPLKLVLQVGGKDVNKLSTCSLRHDSSLFERRIMTNTRKNSEKEKDEKQV